MRSEAQKKKYNLRRRCHRKAKNLLSKHSRKKIIAILGESLFESVQMAQMMGGSYDLVTDKIEEEFNRLKEKVSTTDKAKKKELPPLPPQLPISFHDRVF